MVLVYRQDCDGQMSRLVNHDGAGEAHRDWEIARFQSLLQQLHYQASGHMWPAIIIIINDAT